MTMTDGRITVEVNCDTGHNYDIFADVLDHTDLSAYEILNLFADEFGLQIFSKEHTASMLEELGFEEE